MRSTPVRKARQNHTSDRWPRRSLLAVFSSSAVLLAAIGAWTFFAPPRYARSTDRVIDRKRRKSDNHHYFLAQSQRLSSLSVGQDRRGYKRERYRRLRFGWQPRHALRNHRQRFSEQITPRLQIPKLSAGNAAGATARRRRKPKPASPSMRQSRRRHRRMLARQNHSGRSKNLPVGGVCLCERG
jgi:hypothetical protein